MLDREIERLEQIAESLSFEEWMWIGIHKKWCGPPVCYTHDGLPTALDEDAEWENGMDPCMHIVRMYESPEHAAAVADAHSPSQWRDSYTVRR